MRVLVTGGAGFIGSHTVTCLLEEGHDVLILDNFQNGDITVPDRIASLAGRAPAVIHADITEPETYRAALEKFRPEAVMHFAGLKAVGEAVLNPLEYYRVNVGGSATLFHEIAKVGCKTLVFSSSATVYGDPLSVPIKEDHPCNPTNPYGRNKRIVEQMIEDWSRSDPSVRALCLRYFNPVGAHPSARIGEAPQGTPNNLMPRIIEVAQGRSESLKVFGADYDTSDGTGVRDYIHVMDLAEAHIAGLHMVRRSLGTHTLNLGTGTGYSVLELLDTFQAISGKNVRYVIADRRAGDIAKSIADPSAANERLGWSAQRGLDDMCRDAWAWQAANNG